MATIISRNLWYSNLTNPHNLLMRKIPTVMKYNSINLFYVFSRIPFQGLFYFYFYFYSESSRFQRASVYILIEMKNVKTILKFLFSYSKFRQNTKISSAIISYINFKNSYPIIKFFVVVFFFDVWIFLILLFIIFVKRLECL